MGRRGEEVEADDIIQKEHFVFRKTCMLDSTDVSNLEGCEKHI